MLGCKPSAAGDIKHNKTVACCGLLFFVCRDASLLGLSSAFYKGAALFASCTEANDSLRWCAVNPPLQSGQGAVRRTAAGPMSFPEPVQALPVVGRSRAWMPAEIGLVSSAQAWSSGLWTHT